LIRSVSDAEMQQTFTEMELTLDLPETYLLI